MFHQKGAIARYSGEEVKPIDLDATSPNGDLDDVLLLAVKVQSRF